MNNELEVSKDFQTRMFEKIREQMGELLTDAELKSIVDIAMNKAFFEERIIKNNYGPDTKERPHFISLIEKEMRDKVDKTLKSWIDNNPEQVKKAIDETIAKGVFDLMRQYFHNQIYSDFQMFADNLRNRF